MNEVFYSQGTICEGDTIIGVVLDAIGNGYVEDRPLFGSHYGSYGSSRYSNLWNVWRIMKDIDAFYEAETSKIREISKQVNHNLGGATSVSLAGYNDDKVMEMAQGLYFHSSLSTDSESVKVLTRFFQFYSQGTICEGDTIIGVVLDAIGSHYGSSSLHNFQIATSKAVAGTSQPDSLVVEGDISRGTDLIRYVSRTLTAYKPEEGCNKDMKIITDVAAYLGLALCRAATKSEEQLANTFTKNQFSTSLSTDSESVKVITRFFQFYSQGTICEGDTIIGVVLDAIGNGYVEDRPLFGSHYGSSSFYDVCTSNAAKLDWNNYGSIHNFQIATSKAVAGTSQPDSLVVEGDISRGTDLIRYVSRTLTVYKPEEGCNKDMKIITDVAAYLGLALCRAATKSEEQLANTFTKNQFSTSLSTDSESVKVITRFFQFYSQGTICEGDTIIGVVLDAIGNGYVEDRPLFGSHYGSSSFYDVCTSNAAKLDWNNYGSIHNFQIATSKAVAGISQPDSLVVEGDISRGTDLIRYVSRTLTAYKPEEGCNKDMKIITDVAVYLGLALYRAATKSEEQLANTFTKNQFSTSLAQITGLEIGNYYSPPCKECTRKSSIALNKNDSHIRALFILTNRNKK